MKRLLVILLSLTFVVSCTTAPKAITDRNDEYDFMAVKSYFIVGDQHLKNPMISDIDRSRFNEAISNEFNLQGLVSTDEKSADILINYFVVTQDKMKVTSSGHSAYYGTSSRYGRAYGYGYGVPNVNAKNYTEGTFIVDVIDAKTHKTVWRSTLVKPVKNYDSIEERKQAVTDLINTMFADLG
jgi:hypothetical protein